MTNNNMTNIIYYDDDRFIYDKTIYSEKKVDRQLYINKKKVEYSVNIYSKNKIKNINKIKIIENLFINNLDLFKFKKFYEILQKEDLRKKIFEYLFNIIITEYKEFFIDLLSNSLFYSLKKKGIILNYNVLRFLFSNCIIYKDSNDFGLLFYSNEYISKNIYISISSVRNTIRKLEFLKIINYVVVNKEYSKRYNNSIENKTFVSTHIAIDECINYIKIEDKNKINDVMSKIIMNDLYIKEICENNRRYEQIKTEKEIINLNNLVKKHKENYLKNDCFATRENIELYFNDLKKKKFNFERFNDEFLLTSEYFRRLVNMTVNDIYKKEIKYLNVNKIKFNDNFIDIFDKYINEQCVSKSDIFYKISINKEKGIKQFINNNNNDEFIDNVSIRILNKMKKKKIEINNSDDFLLLKLFKDKYFSLNDKEEKKKYIYNMYKIFISRIKSPSLNFKKINSFIDYL